MASLNPSRADVVVGSQGLLPPPPPVPAPVVVRRIRPHPTTISKGGSVAPPQEEIDPQVQVPLAPSQAPTQQVQAVKRRKVETKASKGLRHFSMKVCKKVEEKGQTTYNEVADELVKEFAEGRGVEGGVEYDEKNIRRRVYDALNVLMAMDIISKQKKEIRWRGLPNNALHDVDVLKREVTKRLQSLGSKRGQLQELLVQQVAFRHLALRNRRIRSRVAAQQQQQQQPVEDEDAGKIALPFIVVNTPKDTVVQCEMAQDRTDVFFNFSDQFEIADDNEMLRRLGLHQCKREELPVLVAKELVPYVPDQAITAENPS